MIRYTLPLADQTAFRRDLLLAVTVCGCTKGVEVHRKIEEIRDENIARSRVYSELTKLSEAGLVEKAAMTGRMNKYSTTEYGRGVIEAYAKYLSDALE